MKAEAYPFKGGRRSQLEVVQRVIVKAKEDRPALWKPGGFLLFLLSSYQYVIRKGKGSVRGNMFLRKQSL